MNYKAQMQSPHNKQVLILTREEMKAYLAPMLRTILLSKATGLPCKVRRSTVIIVKVQNI